MLRWFKKKKWKPVFLKNGWNDIENTLLTVAKDSKGLWSTTLQSSGVNGNKQQIEIVYGADI